MATSYANPCGSGDRRALILVTLTSGTTVAGNINAWVDGNRTDTTAYFAGGVTNLILEFWFPSKKIIDEVTFYQQNTAAHGTFKWQGGHDRTTWTDLGATFTLGGVATQVQTSLAGNTTGYVFYRLVQVSGTTSSSPWIYEFEFKIDEAGTTSYLHPLGSGNRTATISTTSSGISWQTGTPANLVNGTFTTDLYWNNAAAAGHWVQFDLGTAVVLQQARFTGDGIAAQGDWKLQGSPDASGWTDISATVTLGVAAAPTFVTCFGGESHTVAYRYYRLLGVSGSRTTSLWLEEVEFMVGAAPGPALAATASITIATTAALTLASVPLTATSSIRVSSSATLTLFVTPLAATASIGLSTSATFALPGPLRVTQTALELWLPRLVPTRVTQLAVDVYLTTPASLRVSQAVVEVFLTPTGPPGPLPARRLIRRLRRAPHVHDAHRRIAYARFALDLQRGVARGADPVVTLRLSRDGGKTWGEPVTMHAGTLGAYTTRVLARRLGHARDAVFEVTVSDPIAWSLVQAWLDLEPGTS